MKNKWEKDAGEFQNFKKSNQMCSIGVSPNIIKKFILG